MKILSMPERLDFNAKQWFDTQWYEEIASCQGEVILDFSGVHFMNSSGLGVLLLIHARASECKIPLAITGASTKVEKIFELARFDKLFTIRD